MGKFLYLFFLFALVVTAYAAPKEEETEVASTKTAEKKSEREVLVADDTWSTWLSSSSWNIATISGGVIVLLAGLAVAAYYYYYIVAVDATYGQGNALNYNQPGQQYYGYQGQQYAQGRSLDTTPGSRWNFTKVLEYIEIAQKTYEGFDWQNIDCQKRVLCELSQKDNWAGETGRKITNNYLLTVVDALDGIPIPRLIQAYLEQFKEAITQGKNSNKECGSIYKKCKFSIKEVIAAAGQPKKANTL